MIFEVDLLICPEYGGTMKIVSVIDQHLKDVVKKILKHSDLWDDSSPPTTRQTLAEAQQEFMKVLCKAKLF